MEHTLWLIETRQSHTLIAPLWSPLSTRHQVRDASIPCGPLGHEQATRSHRRGNPCGSQRHEVHYRQTPSQRCALQPSRAPGLAEQTRSITPPWPAVGDHSSLVVPRILSTDTKSEMNVPSTLYTTSPKAISQLAQQTRHTRLLGESSHSAQQQRHMAKNTSFRPNPRYTGYSPPGPQIHPAQTRTLTTKWTL